MPAPCGGDGGSTPGGPAATREAGGAAWVLLPVTWCAWLLVWLVPSLLVAPHLAAHRPWLARQTAPAALVAAAALFLAAVWPFWPALGGPRGGRTASRGIGLALVELVMLAALAAPFVLVAWAVGGRTLDVGPIAAAVMGTGVFGLGLRLAAAGIGPGAARWLMFAAAIVCAGPLAVAYAAEETLGIAFPWLTDACPIVAAVRLALDGWPQGAAGILTQLALWPGVGVVLAAVGLWTSARR